MIYASGFVEATDLNDIKKLVERLNAAGIEVTEAKEDKVVFLVERETGGEVKAALDSLKDVDGVRSVYLAYYSLEGGDEDTSQTSFFNA